MVDKILNDLIANYPALDCVKGEIAKAYNILLETYKSGGKVLCCGNGGSSADSDHIVGELMKSFKIKRKINAETARVLTSFGTAESAVLNRDLEGALPALSLNSQNALLSAYINDTNPHTVYAQLLYGIGRAGDTLIALTTSGNSQNCVYAAITAKAMGIKTISMTGMNGGKIKELSDAAITVPESETYRVQELTLPVYHCLCAMLEAYFFG
jgi:D-sedoheptulose 7-phosphate isomerase